MKRMLWGLAACIGLLGGAAGQAKAALALDFTGGSTFLPVGANLGWEFTVAAGPGAAVSALGIWDQGSDGLLESHTITIYKADGTPVLSKVITNGNSFAVASTAAGGRWLFTSIGGALAPGSYVIGAYYDEDATLRDPVRRNAATVTSNAPIAYVKNRSGVDSVPAFPDGTTASAGKAYFGPNFLATVVPEPASMTLLAVGLLGIGGFAWRKRKPA